MHRKTAPTALSLSALALLLTGAVLYAGPLDPPPGPITSTGKTLTEVEPRIAINQTNTPRDGSCVFRISAPGSYYLTGNVMGEIDKSGIKIESSGVTLDLGGFDVVGVPGSLVGVHVGIAGPTNITIRNGSVRNWGADGVNTRNASTLNTRIEGVVASFNAGYGFFIGHSSTIVNCNALSNGVTGIQAGDACTLSGCTSRDNTGQGISVGFGSSVSGCVANSNTANGITAFGNCSIVSSASHFNGGSGFVVGSSSVTNCAAGTNAVNGIVVGSGSSVRGCTANSNGGTGIAGVIASVIADCAVYLNGADGISVSSGCTITGCSVYSNTLDGIRGVSRNSIRGNSCAANGDDGDGAGIHVTSFDNRIEDNNCTGADRGIDVDLAGNFIVRNTCSGNGINWMIVGANVIGPILDRTAPSNVAINGDTGSSTLGTTDANANFTY